MPVSFQSLVSDSPHPSDVNQQISLWSSDIGWSTFSSEENESKIGVSPSRTQRKITFKFEIGDPVLLRSIVEMKLMAHGYDSMVWGQRWIKKKKKWRHFG